MDNIIKVLSTRRASFTPERKVEIQVILEEMLHKQIFKGNHWWIYRICLTNLYS